jgi:antirestriction protein ArdC
MRGNSSSSSRGRASRGKGGGNDEVRQAVTDRMVAALEAGVVPWQKPWIPGGRPRSLSTGRHYQGINTWLLAMTSMERGYTSPWWGTFRQIQELGGNVKKGQNQAEGTGSTKITLWRSFVPKDAEPDPITGKVREVVMARMIPVFNAHQCENLPDKYYPQPDAEPQSIAEPQAVLDSYIGSANAAALEHDVLGQAYYNPATDEIHMPPMKGHKSPEHYYSTAFHEVSHSTGHESRLNRPGVAENTAENTFGQHGYGVEELAAQMGASFLLAETGIDTDEVMDNSAAYLGSWIKTIKEDNKIVIAAASQAQAIADHVLEPARQAQREAAREAVSAAEPLARAEPVQAREPEMEAV